MKFLKFFHKILYHYLILIFFQFNDNYFHYIHIFHNYIIFHNIYHLIIRSIFNLTNSTNTSKLSKETYGERNTLWISKTNRISFSAPNPYSNEVTCIRLISLHKLVYASGNNQVFFLKSLYFH